MHAQKWIVERDRSPKVSYLFEAGHQHQSAANAFMEWLFESASIRAKYGYSGHAFLTKETPCLQPADLLAWQWRLETLRSMDPARTRPRRKDLDALVRVTDTTVNWDRDELTRVRDNLTQRREERLATVASVEAMMSAELIPQASGKAAS